MTGRLARIPWREARLLLYRERRPLGLALLLVVVSRVAALGLPTASKFVVDEVIGRQRADLLLFVVPVACVAVALEAGCTFHATRLGGLAGQRAIAALRNDLQARAVGLPLRRIHDRSTGTLAAQVMADSEQARYLVGNGLVHLVASFLAAAFALALLFLLNLSLTVTTLVLLALFAAAIRRAFHRMSGTCERLSQRQAELTGWLAQRLDGARIVKAYVAERHEAYRFAQQSHHLVRDGMAVHRETAILSTSSTLGTGLIGLAALGLGAWAVAVGDMSLGSLVMFVWLTGLLAAPVGHVATSAGDLGRSLAALARIARLRELATEEEQDRAASRVENITGAVELDRVSYAYVPQRFALRDVSLYVPPGCMLALVGRNGSGKSTLCRLLLAYDVPTFGRIRVDGRDLRTLRRREYRSHVGVVLQDDILFEGSIADNIRYGRPGATIAEVRAAGRLAQCEEFVTQLANGYATQVGERGMRLSAGQRQRVSIARALLADPRILILDEATASLDAESERLIEGALRSLCRGRTTFVVAHRLSTMRRADQIVVLEGGSVVEQGSHERLMALGQWYFRLHEMRTFGPSGRLQAAAGVQALLGETGRDGHGCH